MSDFPKIVPVYPGQAHTPPAELSNDDINMIHARLMIPGAEDIHSMSREIRKWRGIENPDAL